MTRLFNQTFGIKANVWAAKYHEAEEGRKLWKVETQVAWKDTRTLSIREMEHLM